MSTQKWLNRLPYICYCVFFILALGQLSCLSRDEDDGLIAGILSDHPEAFSDLDGQWEKRNIQILYTEIIRDSSDSIRFIDHSFRNDPTSYFYPASTVKLPVAILALQKLRQLDIDGLTPNSPMIIKPLDGISSGMYRDTTSASGYPSIAHFIKKIFLVSDNDAYNRLYEFLGPEYINAALHKRGYRHVRIQARLETNCTPKQNLHTNEIMFLDDCDNVLYRKEEDSAFYLLADTSIPMGKAYYKDGQRIENAFDFGTKNALALCDLHDLIKAVCFPEAIPAHRRFDLTAEDYSFLLKYMRMEPQESVAPRYDTSTYWPAYVKFLYYGSEKGPTNDPIEIYNKVGDAYGFLTDAAYIRDTTKHIEFILSATILCNDNGIYNDNNYTYSEVGYPFLKNLGRVIYDREHYGVN